MDFHPTVLRLKVHSAYKSKSARGLIQTLKNLRSSSGWEFSIYKQQLSKEDAGGTNSFSWVGLKDSFKECLPILRNVLQVSVHGCKRSSEDCLLPTRDGT